MVTIERGVALVERVIARLSDRLSKEGVAAKDVVGATSKELDTLESKLMVELPPTLRAFLQYDFAFASLGKRFRGRLGARPRRSHRPFDLVLVDRRNVDGDGEPANGCEEPLTICRTCLVRCPIGAFCDCGTCVRDIIL